jgi:glycosyltransferase involved in cell wall biosynthesis
VAREVAMRIAFIDYVNWDYDPDTARTRALGGTQSAVCNLVKELVQRGHSVALLNGVPKARQVAGVSCLPLYRLPESVFREANLDVVVVVNVAGKAKWLRRLLPPQTRLVLWVQHDIDQPRVAALADEVEAYDHFALISEYQRGRYVQAFGLPMERIALMRNAASPHFIDPIDPTQPVLSQKSHPPVLAYTSTPFRGLDILLDAFPTIREAVPNTTLAVFSSLAVYNVSAEDDKARFGDLYNRCRETDGVIYMGGVPQPALAKLMGGMRMLAFPSVFPETSCIAAMEAMATGCQIVTTRLGALPETCAGFADLVDLPEEQSNLAGLFAEAVISALTRDRSTVEAHLRGQLNFAREQYTWARRAKEWETFLQDVQPV